jgi:CheY-like chemotaxis protein
MGEVFQEGEIEEDLPQGTERILLVDDEVILVDMVGQMLRRLGYRLTGFSESREALEAVQNQPEAFDLVITDLDMPDLDGLELAREIKALRPDLPIILCTGYPQSVPEDLRGMADAFIAKPISRINLALLIREVLAGSPEGR